jgi:hypothetical protein
MEHINKKWDLPTMEKRLENLKKIINPTTVDMAIVCYTNCVEDRLDALYLAYYDLKDRFCKIKRKIFGKPKEVEYVSKKQFIDNLNNTYWCPSTDYTWSISSASYTTSVSYTYANSTTDSVYYFEPIYGT